MTSLHEALLKTPKPASRADDHMAPSPMKSPNASKPSLANARKNLYAYRAEEKAPSTKMWNRNEYTPASNRTSSISGSGTTQKFENRPNNWKTVQQKKIPDNSNSSQHIKATETSQTRSSKGQWPVKPNATSRSLQDYGLAYKFNSNSQQNNMNEKRLDCVPEDKSQDISSFQLKLKEKRNSLRIISAVIESMKHWSQYTYKTALLFEVLGTLDSAVTSGAQGAKNFLLRDGKETLPCVFYEIDFQMEALVSFIERNRARQCSQQKGLSLKKIWYSSVGNRRTPLKQTSSAESSPVKSQPLLNARQFKVKSTLISSTNYSIGFMSVKHVVKSMHQSWAVAKYAEDDISSFSAFFLNGTTHKLALSSHKMNVGIKKAMQLVKTLSQLTKEMY
ncbi:hypothetical protein ASZ78_002868 [Callipepla squamata]|uniref:Spermatogenesis-associated protein 22 n=1 Tax=Callipepla squamata TaxID=9009 RepID=A0A226MGS7_CALSU|nr:hypothetical protein ASZ78_002868 [Callipepla squamata]